MKLTSPDEIKRTALKASVEAAIEQIEDEFAEDTPDYGDHIRIIIVGEYTTDVRNEVARQYRKRGWSEVTHVTSSENGERPGLTSFMFYF